MKKFYAGLAVIGTSAFFSGANAQDYDAQIDALQNELLKIKQEMGKSSSKAYFKKGKGLSIKSSDGKYEFAIKGRAMFDMAALLGGNSLADYSTTGATGCDNCSRADDIGTFGQEFRRLRFSIKVKIGDGWALAFQPDFAETVSDNSNTGGKGVDVKDAYISKAFKGFGKLYFGNAKSAGGMWENTSSNSILFMERPMYNEAANLAHRAGLHYDSSGAMGPFHLRVALTAGAEGAWRQENEDSDSVEDRYNVSGAAHYTWSKMNDYWGGLSLGKNHKLMVGASWSYENLSDAGTRDIEARAQGVHTLGEKIQDGALANVNDYTYGGPQFAYTNGPLFVAGEWFYVTADRHETTISAARTDKAYGDYQASGGSAFAHYFLTGNTSVPLSAKKGKIGGVKCKGKFGCTAVKVMYEQWNGAHSELSEVGTDAKVMHFGINHYFNSNVRLMIDAARGLYINGTGLNSDDLGSNHEGNLTSVQARLHFKW